MTRVLTVEDDTVFAQEFAEYLGKHGMQVRCLPNLTDVFATIRDFAPTLAVFDQFVGGEDVLSWLPRLRAGFDGGIVVLTGNQELIDRVIGLELGADDFVSKSLTAREILARLRAVARRMADAGPAAPLPAGWTLDAERHRLLTPAGAEVTLTAAEFEVLALLSAHPGEVVTRETLSRSVLRRAFSPLDRSIDNLVSGIRTALQPHEACREAIRSVRGVGYVFVGFG